MRLKLVAVVALALIFTGCLGGGTQRADVGVYLTNSGLGNEVSSSSLSALGFEVAQTDGEIKEIWVTITGVAVQRNGEWETIAIEQDQGRINLMELQFGQLLLGQAQIPAGTYKEIRFQIEKEGNEIVFEDGQTASLKVPSGELKPHLGSLNIPAGTVTELVFDVNTKFFAEKGNGGGYNANPRHSLRFVQAIEAEFGDLEASIQLPEAIEEILSVEVKLFRVGVAEPTWSAELENGVLELSIAYLPPGEYVLEVSLKIADAALITLSSEPIIIKAGVSESVVIK